MRLPGSHRVRALLVVLLLGFATLTLHASMHAQWDQQGCALCSGHFNPSHAIASTARTPILAPSTELVTWLPPRARRSQPFTPYHQRGPPPSP